MDWSYEVLPETEQLVLWRLAVFQGDFTINAAAAVATDERIGTADVFETIANLAAKSLISTDISSDVTYIITGSLHQRIPVITAICTS
jgi:predicted ATPase